MKKLNLDEEIAIAEKQIAADPKAAAFWLAQARVELQRQIANTNAIRVLAQNLDLAVEGDLKALSFAFGRDLAEPVK